MIIVDIAVEALDKTYDFKLDEEVTISKLIDDICEMLSQKEKCPSASDTEKLILCKASTGEILPHNLDLRSCKVVSGDSLMLI
ncbi:MAG: hypothetical protein II998_09940 [Clostridia bacterium]|nr:hypothetical protein [Clostridia bacterium]